MLDGSTGSEPACSDWPIPDARAESQRDRLAPDVQRLPHSASRRARHAAGRRRPRRRSAQNYASLQAPPAARAGLLRREGQPGAGDRPDALQGGRQLRRRVDARVHARLRAHPKRLPAKERQDFIWDKIIYANPIKAEGDAARRSTSTSRWSPSTTSTEIGKITRARAARRAAAAAARAEHRLDGGAVVQVRLRAGRGGGPDRGGPRRRAGRRGPELPRRQPVHQLRELRAGAEHGGGGAARRRVARAST